MDKKKQIELLYKQIFGNKILPLEYGKNPIDLVQQGDDKCKKCKHNCTSYKNRQDLPYFKSFEKVKTMVIAESPGSGIEKGNMGFVFGWEQFEKDNAKKIILKYENYFFKILNLNRDETYITDAIKCYTPKNEFSNTFINCKDYLKEEIEILKPETILVISKHNSLKAYLEELKINFSFNYNLKIIPHPSNQNMSKIKTVSDIFKEIGEWNSDEKWTKLGKQISNEYDLLQKELKSIKNE